MRRLAFWLANVVNLVHVIFGIYILTGWLWPEYYIWYYLSLGSWIGSWLILGYCPLSRLEFSIRNTYNSSINPKREIIQYYIHELTGIFISSQIILISGLGTFFILVLLTILQS